ncbi:MAG: zf-HC2 domain-containing protein [Bryobacteraceae bacterium]
MDCRTVRRSLAGICDQATSPDERRRIRTHLAGCPSCASLSQQYLRGRAALRGLPALRPPAHLIASLRILASREIARREFGAGMEGAWNRWLLRVKLWADAMMRPLALPLAGGLASAVILFALVVPNFFAPHRTTHNADVPTMLSTEPIFVGMGPFGFGGDEVVVELTVDRQGRFVEYSIPSGQAWVKDPEARRSVENALLFTRFSPGTTFGKPASSRVRITLRRSYVDVRG